jgi:hypothetical protein
MTCEIPNDFRPTSAAQASSEPPGSLGNARRNAGKIWGKIRETKKTHGKTWEIYRKNHDFLEHPTSPIKNNGKVLENVGKA